MVGAGDGAALTKPAGADVVTTGVLNRAVGVGDSIDVVVMALAVVVVKSVARIVVDSVVGIVVDEETSLLLELSLCFPGAIYIIDEKTI